VLADYTGIWEITNEVLSCNSSKTRQLLCPLCMARPPKKFSRSDHAKMMCLVFRK